MGGVMRMTITVPLECGQIDLIDESGKGLLMQIEDDSVVFVVDIKDQAEADLISEKALDWYNKHETRALPHYYDAETNWGTIRFWREKDGGRQIEFWDDDEPRARLHIATDEEAKEIVDALELWREERRVLA